MDNDGCRIHFFSNIPNSYASIEIYVEWPPSEMDDFVTSSCICTS
jgi:hypothetical protein